MGHLFKASVPAPIVIGGIELVDVLIKHTSGATYTGSTDVESIPPYLLLEIDEIGKIQKF